MAYSEVTDLLIGDLPMSSTAHPEKFIADAADEIDVALAVRYAVPIDLNSAPPVTRTILKRISNYMASGRLLLRLAISQEQSRLHELGASWLKEAEAALCQIRDGQLVLEGLQFRPEYDDSPAGPLIHNEDSASLVQGFYQFIQPPRVPVFPPDRYWWQ